MPFDIDAAPRAGFGPRYHFLSLSSVDPSDHPLCKRLGAEKDLTVFALPQHFDQSRRARMMLIGWPRMLLDGLRLAAGSVTKADDETVILFDTHLLAFCWLLLWRLRGKGAVTPKLVLGGMIYTPRKGLLGGRFKKAYFGWLLKQLHLVTCYSRNERRSLAALTNGQTPIRVVHYGIGQGTVIANWYRKEFMRREPRRWHSAKPLTVFSAGRSSRDYATLVQAVAAPELATDHPVYLDIVCDNYEAAPPELESDFVVVHRSLHGADYIKKMLQADIVVVPLSNADISAGQMVFLHALAAGKPIIVTDNATVREYLTPWKFCRFVPMGDEEALATAIADMAAQLPATSEEIQRQRARYTRRYTSEHMADRFLGAIEAEWPSQVTARGGFLPARYEPEVSSAMAGTGRR